MNRAEHRQSATRPGSGGTVKAATEVLTGRSEKHGLARLLPFLGPAFIANVAHVDPGNFATNIQGGCLGRKHSSAQGSGQDNPFRLASN